LPYWSAATESHHILDSIAFGAGALLSALVIDLGVSAQDRGHLLSWEWWRSLGASSTH